MRLLVLMLSMVVLGGFAGRLVPAVSAGHVLPSGDANCDGLTNSVDAFLVLQDQAGQLPRPSCIHQANVAYDIFIDSLDALVILQTEAGMIATCSDRDEGLAARLLTDKQRYGVSDSIRMVLTVVNCGEEAITRRYGTYPRDFAIVNPSGRTVWRWSDGTAATGDARPIDMSIDPARPVAIGTALWDQLDREDLPVSPGSYRIVGEAKGCNTTPPEQCGLSLFTTVDIVR